ncbi:MAG TPA: multicopper oxidase family protein [Bryobacteraceae bacterium]|nr:multicopper oxidase family protein [Bryobacteraceae bacterium]
MNRREFLALAASTLPAARLARATGEPAADITLRIAEINADLGNGHVVKTLAYNGQVPGPLVRIPEGKTVTVDVVNQSYRPEVVHWHGFHIPPEVDGAPEEGTPTVQPNDTRRYSFTATPTGTRWYHTHAMAGQNTRIGTYSGQFGMVVVEPRDNPARYDAEFPIILHDWDPFFRAEMEGDVDYRLFTINGKVLGSSDPLRVKSGQRVLFRVLNASATKAHRLALAGHTFQIVALDGNAVPKQATVPVLDLAPAERVDALVEMKNPGVWIFGEVEDAQRVAGAGIVVEYAAAQGRPRWTPPPDFRWDLTAFGEPRDLPASESAVPLVFEPGKNGYLWAINGKSWPHTDEIRLTSGIRNRLVFDNRSGMGHPVHLHRHTFELGSGVRKDVLLVPAHTKSEVDVLADSPGLSLFHCHHQLHMDFGFMALLRY